MGWDSVVGAAIVIVAGAANNLVVARTQTQDNNSGLITTTAEAEKRANIGGAVSATTPMGGVQVCVLVVRAALVTATVVGGTLAGAAVPACIPLPCLIH